MTIDEWLQIGYKNKWAFPPQCDTHEGTPLSDEEDRAFGDGEDPCVVVMRVFNTESQFNGVAEGNPHLLSLT